MLNIARGQSNLLSCRFGGTVRFSLPIELGAQRPYARRVKADFHGTTLSHKTSLRQAYDMNCFL